MYFLLGLTPLGSGCSTSAVMDACRSGSGVHASFFGKSESRDGFFCDSMDACSRLADGTLAFLKGRVDSVRGYPSLDVDDWSSVAAAIWADSETAAGNSFARVYGDFCLIFFNPATRALICVRDGLGVVPVYYHATETSIIFSSSQKALLALPGLKAQVSPTRILIFLQGSEKNTQITCFDGISRVPAGSFLRFSSSADTVISRYWSPYDVSKLGLHEASDICDQLRHYLVQAVGCRVKGYSKIAVELSGGLDSSSVFALASSIASAEVVGYSAIFPEHPRCDESGQIAETHSFLGTQGKYLEGGSLSMIDALDASFHAFKGLHNAGNIHISLSIASEAARDNCQVVLNGVDGDNVFSHGRGRLLELSAAGDWRAFHLEILGLGETFSLYIEDPVPILALQYASPALIMGLKKLRLFYFSRGLYWLNRKCQVPIKVLIDQLGVRVFKNAVRSLRTKGARSSGKGERWWGRYGRALLVPEFLRAVNRAHFAEAEPDKASSDHMTEFDFHAESIGSGLNQHYLEYMHAVSTSVGIPIVSPFMDRQLVEFCLRVPAAEKMKGGFTRAHLRSAMEGLLPPSLLSSKAKANLSDSSTQLFETQCLPVLAEMLESDRLLVEMYLDPLKIERMLEQVRRFDQSQDRRAKLAVLHRLWPIFCFLRWLKSVDDGSVRVSC
ncbi:MAG: asparagine synthase-related protein [Wenzhouxiangella sp.]